MTRKVYLRRQIMPRMKINKEINTADEDTIIINISVQRKAHQTNRYK